MCQPYLTAFVSAEVADHAGRALLARCIEDTRVEKKKEEDDDEVRRPTRRCWRETLDWTSPLAFARAQPRLRSAHRVSHT